MKNTFAKVLSVIVVASIVISATLIISFASSDLAGTAEDGYAAGSGKIHSYNALNEFANSSFSDGLKNWTSTTGEFASTFAQAKNDGAVTYATITTKTSYRGIASRPFMVDDTKLKAGDKIAVIADYRGDDKLQFIVSHVNYTNGSQTESKGFSPIYKSSEENGWSTGVSQTKLVLSDWNRTASTVSRYGEGFRFYIKIQAADVSTLDDKELNTDIKNIRLVKVLDDGTYETLDGEKVIFYDDDGDVLDADAGTRKDGYAAGSNNLHAYKSLNEFANPNFASGLKNWTSTTGEFASTFAQAKNDGAVTYATITTKTSYRGIASRPFMVDDTKLKAGDKIAVIADYRGDDKLQFIVCHVNYTNSSQSESKGFSPIYKSSEENGWSTGVSQTKLELSDWNRTPSTISRYGEGFRFYIKIQAADVSTLDDKELNTDIKNIRLVKVLDDGTYETLDGEKVIFYDDDGDVLDADAGTRKDGYAAGSNNLHAYKALDEFANPNFASGLKNWTSTTGNFASEYATTGKDGDKTYAILNVKDNYRGIASRPFMVDDTKLKAGDTIALMADYRGDTEIQLILCHVNYTDNKNTESKGFATVYKSEESNGWNTGVSQTKIVLSDWNKDPSTISRYGEGFRLYVKIQSADVSKLDDKELNTEITNIRVVKVLEDGSYETLDGNKVIFRDSDGDIFDPNAGTSKNGFATGSPYAIAGWSALSEFTNGDFSKGLKNWTNSKGDYASVYATPKMENGITFATLKVDTNYTGIVSRPFRIEGVKKGDVLAVMVDYRGDSALQLNIEHANYVKDADTRSNGAAIAYKSEISGGWNTAVSQDRLELGDFNTDEAAVSKYGNDYYFYLRIQSADVSKLDDKVLNTDITNIRVVKVLSDGSYETVKGEKIVFRDSDGDIFDPNAGTSKNGFATGSPYAISGWSALSEFTNGDFSKGLKNWTNSKGDYASVYATPKMENGKTFATLKIDTNYTGIVSRPFRIEGVKKGDVLAVMVDYRGDSALQLNIEHANYVKGADTRSNGAAIAYRNPNKNGWNTAVSQDTLELGDFNTEAAAVSKYGKDYYFYLRIQSADVSKLDDKVLNTDVTNIRIVKVLEDGSYQTLSGEKIVFYDEDGSIYDPSSGTYKDGIITGGNYAISGWKRTNGFQNPSFKLGFKHWATVLGVSPSEHAKLGKDEDGTTFITLTSSDYKGIVSQPFNESRIKEGDKIIVMADFRGDLNFALSFEAYNSVKGERANGMKVIYESATGWSTAVSETVLTVGTPKTDEGAVKKYGDQLVFTVGVQPKSGESVTDITNIRVLKVGTNDTYYNLDGTKADYKVGAEEGGEVNLPELLSKSSKLVSQRVNTGTDIAKNDLNLVLIVSIISISVVVISAGVILTLIIFKRRRMFKK